GLNRRIDGLAFALGRLLRGLLPCLLELLPLLLGLLGGLLCVLLELVLDEEIFGRRDLLAHGRELRLRGFQTRLRGQVGFMLGPPRRPVSDPCLLGDDRFLPTLLDDLLELTFLLEEQPQALLAGLERRVRREPAH